MPMAAAGEGGGRVAFLGSARLGPAGDFTAGSGLYKFLCAQQVYSTDPRQGLVDGVPLVPSVPPECQGKVPLCALRKRRRCGIVTGARSPPEATGKRSQGYLPVPLSHLITGVRCYYGIGLAQGFSLIRTRITTNKYE